jgi:UDP-2,3-diacylglucosamine pyrophosphatase LpxH
MRTAIVSDLHLGSGFAEDVLRDAGIRRILLEELASADRLVLLGDVLELRELPLAPVLERARPFFEELAKAMAGRPILLVPGNHDHRLAEPLLERLAIAGKPLGFEHRTAPDGEVLERLAAWLGGSELEISYPGIWLRDDVYATHGHYMDCHMTLPRLECIAAAATMRVLRSLPDHPHPADYEGILRPVYGLTYGIAQGGMARRTARPSERAWRAATERAWKATSARNGSGRVRRAAVRAAIPATIWGINRLLHANFSPSLSATAISASGVDAAAELAERLRLDAPHLITGHTHRGGPYEGDPEWTLPGGGRLHNSGSWVFASAFHHPGTPPGPYWPGTVTWLDDEAPPQRKRLLLGHSRDELRATIARSAAASA